MTFSRRQVGKAAVAAMVAVLLPLGATAQGTKKLTIVVGFPPGGAPDTVARALGEGLQAQNYTTIVENKAGAAGRLAADALLMAPSDGTTVMIVPAGVLTIHPHIYSKLRYDTLKDFVPLATAGQFGFGLAVGPAVPASVRTVPEFVTWAKENPREAQFGSPGAGTAMHFLGIDLGRAGQFEYQHIPYRGGAPAIADVMGGSVPSAITTLPLLIKQHQAGRLRILAHTGEDRSKILPDVPTFKEAGVPALTMNEMFVVVGNARMPAAVQKDLAAAFASAGATSTVRRALEAADFDYVALTPAQIADRLRTDYERWGKTVKSTGFKVED